MQSGLFVQNFLTYSTEKFRWGTLRCIGKFPVSKNFMHKKGISLNSVEKFLSHSVEKFRRGTLQCVTDFGYLKILCFRELCHNFVSKFFCLTVSKNFVGEPF